MLVLRLDVHVNGLEQMVGGIDAAWIRERIDPVVRDLVPDAQREVTFPDVPAARSGVQEIDPGFRVVVAWLLAAGIEPTEQQLSRWRTWIETRLRRSEHGARIHDVRMYVRDA